MRNDELALDRVGDAGQGVVRELVVRNPRQRITESAPRDRKAPVGRGNGPANKLFGTLGGESHWV